MLIFNHSSDAIFVEVPCNKNEIFFYDLSPGESATFKVQSDYHIHSKTRGSAVYVPPAKGAITFGSLRVIADENRIDIT